jgi:hypothetical protein
MTLAAIEAVPLAGGGLPATTYDIVTRAAAEPAGHLPNRVG